MTQLAENPQPGNRYDSNQVPWFSIAQLAFSAIAIFLLIATASLFLLLGLGMVSGNAAGINDPTPAFMWAAGFMLSAVLIMPSAVFAMARLSGKKAAPHPRHTRFPGQGVALLLLIILPLVVALGNRVSQAENLAWLALPPLHLLAVGIPVFVLLQLGSSGLTAGSLQRAWGVFSAGLVIGPGLILFFEVVVLFAFILLGAFVVSSQSANAQALIDLSQRLRFASPNPQAIYQILEPYLLHPMVIFGVMAFTAGLVPVIEEFFKPVGVWLLIRRNLTPAEGFTAGLLSGAGYALFENLLLSGVREGWTALVLARAGTAVVHIFTAGLTGWALVSAWRQRRYLRLAVGYLSAVAIHGMWNALTLVTVGGALLPEDSTIRTSARWLLDSAPYGLGVLVVAVFSLLLGFNFWLRRTAVKHPYPLELTDLEKDNPN